MHLNRGLKERYLELLDDLGIPAFPEIRQRCAEIERILPRVSDLAETIIVANGEVEDD